MTQYRAAVSNLPITSGCATTVAGFFSFILTCKTWIPRPKSANLNKYLIKKIKLIRYFTFQILKSTKSYIANGIYAFRRTRSRLKLVLILLFFFRYLWKTVYNTMLFNILNCGAEPILIQWIIIISFEAILEYS